MRETVVNIDDLVDIALGKPKNGVLDLTALSSLLHIIVRKLNLENCKVEILDPIPELIQCILEMRSPIAISEYSAGKLVQRDDSFKDNNSVSVIKMKRIRMMSDFLDDDEAFVANILFEIFTRTFSAESRKSENSSNTLQHVDNDRDAVCVLDIVENIIAESVELSDGGNDIHNPSAEASKNAVDIDEPGLSDRDSQTTNDVSSEVYISRQLQESSPDLVEQFVVSNDVNALLDTHTSPSKLERTRGICDLNAPLNSQTTRIMQKIVWDIVDDIFGSAECIDDGLTMQEIASDVIVSVLDLVSTKCELKSSIENDRCDSEENSDVEVSTAHESTSNSENLFMESGKCDVAVQVSKVKVDQNDEHESKPTIEHGKIDLKPIAEEMPEHLAKIGPEIEPGVEPTINNANRTKTECKIESRPTVMVKTKKNDSIAGEESKLIQCVEIAPEIELHVRHAQEAQEEFKINSEPTVASKENESKVNDELKFEHLVKIEPEIQPNTRDFEDESNSEAKPTAEPKKEHTLPRNSSSKDSNNINFFGHLKWFMGNTDILDTNENCLKFQEFVEIMIEESTLKHLVEIEHKIKPNVSDAHETEKDCEIEPELMVEPKENDSKLNEESYLEYLVEIEPEIELNVNDVQETGKEFGIVPEPTKKDQTLPKDSEKNIFFRQLKRFFEKVDILDTIENRRELKEFMEVMVDEMKIKINNYLENNEKCEKSMNEPPEKTHVDSQVICTTVSTQVSSTLVSQVSSRIEYSDRGIISFFDDPKLNLIVTKKKRAKRQHKKGVKDFVVANILVCDYRIERKRKRITRISVELKHLKLFLGKK